jgi:prepilin-type N-terminal cleavage/methylation domain-containing protein
MTMRSLAHNRGFTLLEIMIIIGIMSIIVMIAIPTWLRQRELTRGAACQENLAKIDQAKELYALESRLTNGTPVVMSDLVRSKQTGYLKYEPHCAAGGSYGVNPIGTDPTCSYYGSESPTDVNPHRI